MWKAVATVGLLVVSNAFMTLAWYGHIAFKSKLERFGLVAIVLISWGIALFEYCFQVPANRIGSAQFGGPFTLWQLKVIQEVVSLSVFTDGARDHRWTFAHPRWEPSVPYSPIPTPGTWHWRDDVP